MLLDDHFGHKDFSMPSVAERKGGGVFSLPSLIAEM
jgi:hypothetical protein